MHQISFATHRDLPDLCRFLDEHWRKDHVFVRHPELLAWQHGRPDSDVLNFVIARDPRTGVIDACNGVIGLTQFDSALADHRDIWLAIWKRREAPGVDSTLGLDLYKYIVDQLAPRSIGILGLSKAAKTLYRFLGFEVGVTSHTYILNDAVERFTIADLGGTMVRPTREEGATTIAEESVDALAEIAPRTAPPHKSVAYMRKRYAEHPVYRYRFLVARVDGKARCALVTRRVRVGDASALRMVDLFGSLAGAGRLEAAVRAYLRKTGAEYLDCVHAGIDAALWEQAGFEKKQDPVVIPDYFEPFERRNVELVWAFKSEEPGYVFFKGDGDQDRPNGMKKEAP
jgi:hypothetical protein